MNQKKKIAESNAAQLMLNSEDFKEYMKTIWCIYLYKVEYSTVDEGL